MHEIAKSASLADAGRFRRNANRQDRHRPPRGRCADNLPHLVLV
jgi:hypothetical protein